MDRFRFGLKAYVVVLLVTVPAMAFLLGQDIPQWLVAGYFGGAAAAGAFEAVDKMRRDN